MAVSIKEGLIFYMDDNIKFTHKRKHKAGRIHDNLKLYLENLYAEEQEYWETIGANRFYQCKLAMPNACSIVLYDGFTNDVCLKYFSGKVYWKDPDMSILSTWIDEVIMQKKIKNRVIPSLYSMAKLILVTTRVNKPGAIDLMPSTLKCSGGQPSCKRLRICDTASELQMAEQIYDSMINKFI